MHPLLLSLLSLSKNAQLVASCNKQEALNTHFMAVEAGHHTLFHPQMMLTDNQTTGNTPLAYGLTNPLTAMYGFTDGFPANTAPIKAESGLTCSLPVSRKRPRDCSDLNTLLSFVNSRNMNQNQNQNHGNATGTYTFLGEDISMQIQQQQLEIDQFIAHQTDKVRIDIEERRKRNSRRLIAAVEENISNRLRAKEEEIMKIAKLNWALEEKVKSLCVENQIWRELAQTNEATANALRSNLKQVLEHVVHDEYRHRNTTAACVDDAAALAEDAQSCCESNNEDNQINDDCCTSNNNKNNNNRLCKKCGKDESCVLLLPCRHLCLCTVCASSVNICPVCKSTKNISVHVNMS
ncbi:putative transcription factor C2H2 family [Helianthus anomalus]